MNQNDFDLANYNFIDSSGKSVKGKDLINYFEKRKSEMLTITEPLNIGDIVELKTTGEIVKVTEINPEEADYAGYVDGETALTLFGQEDIEQIIERANGESIKII